MNSEKWPDLNKPLAIWLGVAVVIALAAAGYGFYVDSRQVLTQPELFWPFLILSLAGTLVGGRIALRNDRNPLRNVIGMIGSLVAWRVSYFPFMVVAVWTVHHGCDDSHHIARTQRGWFKNFISYQMFHHIEHHLFPAVPTCHWPDLGKRLDKAAPELKDMPVY